GRVPPSPRGRMGALAPAPRRATRRRPASSPRCIGGVPRSLSVPPVLRAARGPGRIPRIIHIANPKEGSVTVEDACIITCAVSGAVANKAQCEGIPYTPEEYAKEVRRARDSGASMVHIHARQPDGTPTVDPKHYKAITQAILGETPA